MSDPPSRIYSRSILGNETDENFASVLLSLSGQVSPGTAMAEAVAQPQDYAGVVSSVMTINAILNIGQNLSAHDQAALPPALPVQVQLPTHAVPVVPLIQPVLPQSVALAIDPLSGGSCLDALGKAKKKCQHGNYKGKCSKCLKCEHGRNKHRCKECGGCEICVHGNWYYLCKECPNAPGICPHGKQKRSCGEESCKSTANLRCEHKVIKTACRICTACEHGKAKRWCGICKKTAKGGSETALAQAESVSDTLAQSNDSNPCCTLCGTELGMGGMPGEGDATLCRICQGKRPKRQ